MLASVHTAMLPPSGVFQALLQPHAALKLHIFAAYLLRPSNIHEEYPRAGQPSEQKTVRSRSRGAASSAAYLLRYSSFQQRAKTDRQLANRSGASNPLRKLKRTWNGKFNDPFFRMKIISSSFHSSGSLLK